MLRFLTYCKEGVLSNKLTYEDLKPGMVIRPIKDNGCLSIYKEYIVFEEGSHKYVHCLLGKHTLMLHINENDGTLDMEVVK